MKTFPITITITLDIERRGLCETAIVKGVRYLDGEIDGTIARVDGVFVELTRAEEDEAMDAIEQEYLKLMSKDEAKKE